MHDDLISVVQEGDRLKLLVDDDRHGEAQPVIPGNRVPGEKDAVVKMPCVVPPAAVMHCYALLRKTAGLAPVICAAPGGKAAGKPSA